LKKFYLPIFIGLLVVSTAIAWLLISSQNSNKDIVSVVEQFVQYLCNKEIEQAIALSTGEVNHALGSRGGDPVLTATLRRLDTEVTAHSKNIALVNVTADIQQVDGTYNTTWYQILLINKQDNWKVARIQPFNFMGGVIGGKTGNLESAQVEYLKTSFLAYTEAMAGGNWEEAGKYLVGPAKTAHNASNNILSKGQIIQDINSLELKPAWASKTDIISRATYKMINRDIEVIIHFHLTDGGWKIAEISNIGGGKQ